jgi:hypothetical protein
MPRTKLNGERLLDSIVSDFEYQRPHLTKKQADDLDAALRERWAPTRRTGLDTLTVSGKKLIRAIAGKSVHQSAAVDKVREAYSLREYAERLRGFAVLMDSASTRISLAARWRKDYETVADAARDGSRPQEQSQSATAA